MDNAYKYKSTLSDNISKKAFQVYKNTGKKRSKTTGNNVTDNLETPSPTRYADA